MSHSRIITNQNTVNTLRSLYREKGKLLHPKDIVEAARAETSPLHSHFLWDDSEAAERYRVTQARELLQRVFVKVSAPNGSQHMAQVFVSLTTDREKGGYRTMVDVLSDEDLRNQMIRDAMAEMQLFTERYKTLRELASVFSAMKKAGKKLKTAA